jgi:hypothetical protein
MFPILTVDEYMDKVKGIPNNKGYIDALLEAQRDLDLQNYVKWGEETCKEEHIWKNQAHRKGCPQCWAELRKQAGLDTEEKKSIKEGFKKLAELTGKYYKDYEPEI